MSPAAAVPSGEGCFRPATQINDNEPRALPWVVEESLAASDGAHDQIRLRSGRDRLGQRGIRGFVGEILLAGEETHKGRRFWVTWSRIVPLNIGYLASRALRTDRCVTGLATSSSTSP